MSEVALKKEIINTIGKSFSEDRIKLAKKIIRQKIPLKSLFPILYMDHPTSTRFSWLLGDISAIDPDKAPEIIVAGFKNFDRIHILNFDRTLAKQCMICGDNLPKKIEGEIVDRLFSWLNDPAISVATKYYSLLCLYHLCGKYPDLKNELITSIQALIPHSSVSLKRCSRKIMSKLQAKN